MLVNVKDGTEFQRRPTETEQSVFEKRVPLCESALALILASATRHFRL
jgi:hypothetical protein